MDRILCHILGVFGIVTCLQLHIKSLILVGTQLGTKVFLIGKKSSKYNINLNMNLVNLLQPWEKEKIYVYSLNNLNWVFSNTIIMSLTNS